MLTITGDSPSSCSNDLGATKTWRLLTATLARPYLTLGDVEPAEAMYKQALKLEGGLGLQSRTRPSTSREGGAGCGHVQVDRLTARGDSGKFTGSQHAQGTRHRVRSSLGSSARSAANQRVRADVVNVGRRPLSGGDLAPRNFAFGSFVTDPIVDFVGRKQSVNSGSAEADLHN